MKFELLLSVLDQIDWNDLPGQEAQKLALPAGREKVDLENILKNNPKRAAVAALFYPDKNGVGKIVFIARNSYPGVHSNQIGFPGGQFEKADLTAIDTAARETHEEIGVHPSKINFHGALTPLYIPPSNFYVEPFLASIEEEPHFIPDPKEVRSIITHEWHHFLENDFHETKVNVRGGSFKVPSFSVQGEIIWGATAMMLAEMIVLFKKHM